ncbi:hypothetical protein KQX54_017900 [Cotesia glomerata]|uniref:Transmembrane protein n=1 Tax=Cotesia glomerata TaxID=32391 RepID=A0AAV7ID19_COTGL|nr:hypothetical protein KQX54_017900 [Cotesia glomerata]
MNENIHSHWRNRQKPELAFNVKISVLTVLSTVTILVADRLDNEPTPYVFLSVFWNTVEAVVHINQHKLQSRIPQSSVCIHSLASVCSPTSGGSAGSTTPADYFTGLPLIILLLMQKSSISSGDNAQKNVVAPENEPAEYLWSQSSSETLKVGTDQPEVVG